MDIAAGPGVMCSQADLLPGHADYPVGGHAPADPVVAAAVLAAFPRPRWGSQHRARGESFRWGGHLQRLMPAFLLGSGPELL